MNPRTLLILAVVTILLALAAGLAYMKRAAPTEGPASDVLFAGLVDRVNDVAGVTIEGGSGTLHITRAGEDWGLAEKGGYPVEFDKIKQAIMNVAELEIVEPKTSKPDLYDRLGVQDPGEGVTSRRVTLEDASGGAIASLIIGERAEGATARHYVRRADEPQAWLVQGDLEITDGTMDWIDAQIVLVSRDRIASVTITHPDGEEVHLSRQSKDERDFEVDDIPEGFELRYAGIAGTVGSGASYLRSEDVSALADIACDEDETIAEFRTFDGLLITAWTCPKENRTWARFHAEAFEVEPPEDGEQPAEDGPDVAADVERINGRLDGWRFELTAAQADNLRKRMADLTKAVEPPPAEEATEQDAASPASQPATAVPPPAPAAPPPG